MGKEDITPTPASQGAAYRGLRNGTRTLLERYSWAALPFCEK